MNSIEVEKFIHRTNSMKDVIELERVVINLFFERVLVNELFRGLNNTK